MINLPKNALRFVNKALTLKKHRHLDLCFRSGIIQLINEHHA
jgi:hypothetical protein